MGVGVTVTTVVADELAENQLEGLVETVALRVELTHCDADAELKYERVAETVGLGLCSAVAVPLE